MGIIAYSRRGQFVPLLFIKSLDALCREMKEVIMDIKSLIGETTDYEKKVELELRKPKSWCKSVSAFANGLGGILIFGIDNNDNIVGLEDARSDSEKISEQVKSYLEPIPEFNLSIQSLEKKNCFRSL